MANSKMSVAELDKFLRVEFPQAFAAGNIVIERADGESCRLRERFGERMLRPGGTVSGPTLMALADCAMYVVLLSAIGPVGLAVTTNLNIISCARAHPARTYSPKQNFSSSASASQLGKWPCCQGHRPIRSRT